MIIFHGPLVSPVFPVFCCLCQRRFFCLVGHLAHQISFSTRWSIRSTIRGFQPLKGLRQLRPVAVSCHMENGRSNPKSYYLGEKTHRKIIRSLCFSLLAKSLFWSNFIYTAQSQIVSKISRKLQVLSSGFSSKAEAKSFRPTAMWCSYEMWKICLVKTKVWDEGMNQKWVHRPFLKKKKETFINHESV